MSDSSWPLQQAIYSALDGDATLATFVGERIYDAVPQNADYPYVVIGEDTASDWSTKPDGGGTADGQDHDVMVHVWSRYAGMKEAKQIQAAIYDVLHDAALSVSGHSAVLIRCSFTDSFLDEDLVTRHGVQRFTALIHD